MTVAFHCFVILIFGALLARCGRKPGPTSTPEGRREYQKIYQANIRAQNAQLDEQAQKAIRATKYSYVRTFREKERQKEKNAVQVTPWGTTTDHAVLNAMQEKRDRANALQRQGFNEASKNDGWRDTYNLKQRIRALIREPPKSVDKQNLLPSLQKHKTIIAERVIKKGNLAEADVHRIANEVFDRNYKNRHSASSSAATASGSAT